LVQNTLTEARARLLVGVRPEACVAAHAPDRHWDALPWQRLTLSSRSAPAMKAARERLGPPAYYYNYTVMEEKACQPKTKLGAIAHTRHNARLRSAKRSRTKNSKPTHGAQNGTRTMKIDTHLPSPLLRWFRPVLRPVSGFWFFLFGFALRCVALLCAVYVQLRLVLFSAGGPFLPSISVNRID
jgi:hypothetical protein